MQYMETFIKLMANNPAALQKFKDKLLKDYNEIGYGLSLVDAALLDNKPAEKAVTEATRNGG